MCFTWKTVNRYCTLNIIPHNSLQRRESPADQDSFQMFRLRYNISLLNPRSVWQEPAFAKFQWRRNCWVSKTLRHVMHGSSGCRPSTSLVPRPFFAGKEKRLGTHCCACAWDYPDFGQFGYACIPSILLAVIFRIHLHFISFWRQYVRLRLSVLKCLPPERAIVFTTLCW